jgi:putative membrane protein
MKGTFTFQVVGVVAGLMLATLNAAGQGTRPAVSATDRSFMEQVAAGGMAEVEHGRLASQNAGAAKVKEFGQRMVTDHGKAGDELKALASRKQVMLPTTLTPEHRAKQDELAALKGSAFDRAYSAHMVMAHEKTVALFEKHIKEGTDAELKAWAEKTLPTVQTHLKLARELSAER